jgi:hypothetical protein
LRINGEINEWGSDVMPIEVHNNLHFGDGKALGNLKQIFAMDQNLKSA